MKRTRITGFFSRFLRTFIWRHYFSLHWQLNLWNRARPMRTIENKFTFRIYDILRNRWEWRQLFVFIMIENMSFECLSLKQDIWYLSGRQNLSILHNQENDEMKTNCFFSLDFLSLKLIVNQQMLLWESRAV